jgi:hypothetical protein
MEPAIKNARAEMDIELILKYIEQISLFKMFRPSRFPPSLPLASFDYGSDSVKWITALRGPRETMRVFRYAIMYRITYLADAKHFI